MNILSGLKKYFTTVFAIDIRGLAIIRIVLGLVIIVELIAMFGSLGPFFTNAGVIPDHSYITEYWKTYNYISLHSISREYTFQLILRCIHLIIAILFTLGIKSKTTSIALRYMTLSLHGNNPHLLSGSDAMLRTCLFRCMFLPLSKVRSRDSRHQTDVPHASYLGIGTIGFILQLGMIYIGTYIYKSDPMRRIDFTSVEYMMQNKFYLSAVGQRVSTLAIPQYIYYRVTIAVIYIEGFARYGLLLPLYRQYGRYLAIILMLLMHGGMLLLVHVDYFSHIATACWIALLPSSFWNRITQTATHAGVQVSNNITQWILGVAVILLTLHRNYHKHTQQHYLPLQTHKFMFVLGLDQYRAMFSRVVQYEFRFGIQANQDGKQTWLKLDTDHQTFVPHDTSPDTGYTDSRDNYNRRRTYIYASRHNVKKDKLKNRLGHYICTHQTIGDIDDVTIYLFYQYFAGNKKSENIEQESTTISCPPSDQTTK